MKIWESVFDDYEVSRYGAVRSSKFGKSRVLKQVEKIDNRRDENGNGRYLVVHLYKNGIREDWPVHVLVAQAFIPNPEGKPTVNHKDGKKMHNWVDNLEWATYSENIQHAFDTGLKKR